MKLLIVKESLNDVDSDSGNIIATPKILNITIPTGPHKSLHKKLYTDFTNQVDRINLRRNWKTFNSTRYPPNRNGGGNRKNKEGDSSNGPIPERNKEGSWPTLVFEVGYSESLEKLHNDKD